MIDELIDCIAGLDDQICSDSWYSWVKSKPHPSFTRRAMASSFEMEELCMVFCYYQYKATWDAQLGE